MHSPASCIRSARNPALRFDAIATANASAPQSTAGGRLEISSRYRTCRSARNASSSSRRSPKSPKTTFNRAFSRMIRWPNAASAPFASLRISPSAKRSSATPARPRHGATFRGQCEAPRRPEREPPQNPLPGFSRQPSLLRGLSRFRGRPPAVREPFIHDVEAERLAHRHRSGVVGRDLQLGDGEELILQEP